MLNSVVVKQILLIIYKRIIRFKYFVLNKNIKDR